MKSKIQEYLNLKQDQIRKTTIVTFQLVVLSLFSLGVSAQNAGTFPNTQFSVSSNVVCVGDAVQFSDLSGGDPTSWLWNFNGGTPSSATAQNPVVTYNLPGKYSVILKATNDGGSLSKGVLNMVTVLECTGLREHKDSYFKIYPNPAQSFVNLAGTRDGSYTLYNAIGSLLLKGSISQGQEIKFELDNFSAGIYYLSVKEGNRAEHFKVIKE